MDTFGFALDVFHLLTVDETTDKAGAKSSCVSSYPFVILP